MYIRYPMPSDEEFRDIIHAWLSFANDNYTEAEEVHNSWIINDNQLAGIKSAYIESIVYKEKAADEKKAAEYNGNEKV